MNWAANTVHRWVKLKYPKYACEEWLVGKDLHENVSYDYDVRIEVLSVLVADTEMIQLCLHKCITLS